MSWPLSQDYNEAIQDPRNSFSDAELKAGEAVCNALGIPLPRSGNFADVYEVRSPSGARWAVKCFTREVHGLRERYAEISKYLGQANLPFMVDFQYLEQGIRVRGQWYPVLKMQWVEGFVLNEFVRDNLDKKPILHSLGQIWLRMGRRLREAKLAHCDLQHGNVLFVPGSTANSLAVKLIDYDGMCVPSLAGKNSGELGHPAYQHPERLRAGSYNQEVDRFSLLSIAAALRCLTVGGRLLWERYDNGDNLLFRQADLQAPAESPLFQELLAIGDAQAQMLVTGLYRACQGTLAAVPLLADLVPEKRPAGKVTTAVSRSAAAAPETDWDFGDEEPTAPRIRKRRSSGVVPLWAWGMMGGAAALLLSVGAGLLLRSAPTKNEGTPIARHRPEAKAPNPTPQPQPPKSEPQPTPKPVNSLPKPTPPPLAVPGQAAVWDPPVDPNRDCKFQNAGGKLTIAVPAKSHVLHLGRNGMNSPRLLSDIEGDFTVQVRVGGDFTPAAASTTGARYSWIGSGLLLWVDGNTFLRLERAGWYGRRPSTLYANWEVREDAKLKDTKHNFPSLSAAATYLRLERRGNQILPSYSEDGQNWIDVKPLDIELPAKVKIGVLAGSTTSRPFAPIFDQFQLKKGQGEMVRVDWPSIFAAGTIVEKTSPSPEEPDAWSHLDVPSDLKPDAKDSVLRIPRGRTVATREEYSGPLDITIVVRGPLDQDVSFIAPGGAMVTFRYIRTGQRTHLLNVRRPDNPSSELGTVVASLPLILPENKWHTLHWEIKSTGMKVSINKQPVFQDPFRYNLTAKYPVKIRVNKATVEVKSVVVKSLKK